MVAKFLRVLGGHAAQKQVRQHLDARKGWKMMTDKHVSGWTKVLALALAIAFVAALIAVEAPIEILFALLVPPIGGILDFFVDGIEVVLLPGLLACAMLPWIETVRNARRQKYRASGSVYVPGP